MKASTESGRRVRLIAVWGNDDAESSKVIASSTWKKIQGGADYETSAWSWYEGCRIPARWIFHSEKVTIFSGERECVTDLSIEELIIQ